MVTRKDLIIAVLATFCLTAMMFMITPIRSSTNTYNPLLDANHDGTIGLQDLVQFAQSYGTTGDPTINVNVTNWPQTYSLQYETINMSVTAGDGVNGAEGSVIDCGGYSRLSVLFNWQTNASIGAGNSITIYLDQVWWSDIPIIPTSYSYITIDAYNPNTFNFTVFNGFEGSGEVSGSFMVETKAPYCFLEFLPAFYSANVPANWWVTFNYAVYLRNE